jgi:DNA-directed RNA polymerase specialized sigma24 family protein
VPEEELDDLLQNLFLQLPTTARRFDPSRSAKPWLFGVTTMLVRRNRRSAARALRRLARWRLDPPTPTEPTMEACAAARGVKKRGEQARRVSTSAAQQAGSAVFIKLVRVRVLRASLA